MIRSKLFTVLTKEKGIWFVRREGMGPLQATGNWDFEGDRWETIICQLILRSASDLFLFGSPSQRVP